MSDVKQHLNYLKEQLKDYDSEIQEGQKYLQGLQEERQSCVSRLEELQKTVIEADKEGKELNSKLQYINGAGSEKFNSIQSLLNKKLTLEAKIAELAQGEQ